MIKKFVSELLLQYNLHVMSITSWEGSFNVSLTHLFCNWDWMVTTSPPFTLLSSVSLFVGYNVVSMIGHVPPMGQNCDWIIDLWQALFKSTHLLYAPLATRHLPKTKICKIKEHRYPVVKLKNFFIN